MRSFYWLKSRVFPSARRLFVMSPPGEPTTFDSFPATTQIFLPSTERHHKMRWYAHMPNVHLLPPGTTLDEEAHLDEPLQLQNAPH